MNGKAPIVLVLAGICGLIAMFGVRKLINQKTSEEVEMREVLVAAREIRVEESITADMVELKSMPASAVPPGSFTEFEQIAGRWAMIRMLKGDPILEAKLAPEGTPTGLVARITPGMRAFAVRVDEQSGVSGFILPDYRVDVIQSNVDGQGQAVILLQNIRVLASGNVIESSEDRSIQARTVTLEVTPEQAELLAASMQRGSLSLTLRGLNDKSMAKVDESEPPSSRNVLVATREIGAEEPITEDMTMLTPMPIEAIPDGTLSSFAQIAGRRAKMTLFQGEPILAAKLAEPGTSASLVSRIGPGMRAIAIKVDEQTSVSGFIRPNDRVDVLRSLQEGSDEALILVRDVRVLAFGTTIASSDGTSTQAQTVTLEVTPEQAELLAGAIGRDTLSLTLRGEDQAAPDSSEDPGDSTPELTEMTDLADRDDRSIEDSVIGPVLASLTMPSAALLGGPVAGFDPVACSLVSVPGRKDEPTPAPAPTPAPVVASAADRIEPPTRSGLVSRIEPGMRAFSITVDDQSGVSGFIRPGDRVDVLQPSKNPDEEAKLLLQNVPVLAAGNLMDNHPGGTVEAETVTLEVSPEDAKVLASALQNSPLALMLRHPGDSSMVVEKKPEPVPEPEPEPVPELPDVPTAKPDPTRTLVIFPGRERPRLYVLGASNEPMARAGPTATGTPEAMMNSLGLPLPQGNMTWPSTVTPSWPAR